MGVKTLASIVLFVVLALASDARAQQSGTSVPPSPAWNDNSLTPFRKRVDTLLEQAMSRSSSMGTMHSRSHRRSA